MSDGQAGCAPPNGPGLTGVARVECGSESPRRGAACPPFKPSAGIFVRGQRGTNQGRRYTGGNDTEKHHSSAHARRRCGAAGSWVGGGRLSGCQTTRHHRHGRRCGPARLCDSTSPRSLGWRRRLRFDGQPRPDARHSATRTAPSSPAAPADRGCRRCRRR